MGEDRGIYLRIALFCLIYLFCLVSCSTTAPNASTTPKDRIILMPDLNGKAGEVIVSNRGGSQVLSKPFQQTQVTDLNTAPSMPTVLEEARIKEIFGAAITAQPEPPVRYILYFHNATNRLTDDSLRIIPQILATIQKQKATWIGVVGHTDRVGWRTRNYELSLSRAETMKDILVSKGVNPGFIQLGAHGEDNALIWTDDEIPEPRNRRVEVTIR